MNFVSVKNFEQLQHYKDRSPPWIKLYNDLLDDYEFACLQDASKLHLVMIWLLASRNNNRLPADPDWIARRINATEPVDVNVLIDKGFLILEQDASNALAGCKQNAIPEREQSRAEREGASAPPPTNGHSRRFTPPTVEQVREYVTERGSHVDPERFVDFYSAKGWKIGKDAMKDWQAAVRTWEKRGNGETPQEQQAWR